MKGVDFTIEDIKILREHPEKPFEIYRLSYGGNVQAAKIYNYLYKNSTVHLERKRIKFLTSPYIE